MERERTRPIDFAERVHPESRANIRSEESLRSYSAPTLAKQTRDGTAPSPAAPEPNASLLSDGDLHLAASVENVNVSDNHCARREREFTFDLMNYGRV